MLLQTTENDCELRTTPTMEYHLLLMPVPIDVQPTKPLRVGENRLKYDTKISMANWNVFNSNKNTHSHTVKNVAMSN